MRFMDLIPFTMNWMGEVMCLCGRDERCAICDPDPRIAELKKFMTQIDETALDAMTEARVGAKTLASLRWIRKLAGRALGKVDD